MDSQKTKKESFSSWLITVGVIVLRDTEAAYHSLEMCFTAVGTTKSLLDFTMVSSMDGVQGSFYDKKDQQLVIKEAWVSQALGAHYIEEKRQKLVFSEINFLWALQNWIQNDIKGEDNHTVQFWHDCHLDRNIHVSSRFWYAVDGEAFCGVDEQLRHWVAMKPEAECFKPFWERIFPYKKIKHYMQEDCVEPLRKVLKYSHTRENVPPEVTVSRHDTPDDDRVTLFCRATGFYPRSITLHWERDGALGVWGQESSTGILPNVDATFYLQVTLELPPSDPGTGYTCVVEHSELETPGIFPVPEKPSIERRWAMVLSILAIVILVLSCAGAFNTWRKRKAGISSQCHLESCTSSSSSSAIEKWES